VTPSESILQLWRAYEALDHFASRPYRVWYFGDNQDDADGLVALVLAGTKQATASALWAHESDREPIPATGDLCVVTNWAGLAQCIIRTTFVEVVAYNEVTPAFAAIEGEGDKSLAYWKTVHWPYFSREMRRIRRELTELIPVVCHQFELVYPRLR